MVLAVLVGRAGRLGLAGGGVLLEAGTLACSVYRGDLLMTFR